jgi:hypothetical protein
MSALVAAVLLSSLLGSPHCAAMCGGFACFYAGQPGEGRRILPHLAYNGGRLVSYLVLGAIAGALGAGVDLTGRAAGFARPAAVAAGLLMIGWGAATLARAGGARLPAWSGIAAAKGALRRGMARTAGRPPVARALALGLLTTLLPCGWLYVFVATAGGTGSAVRGALVMAAFWLGTVPILAGVGLVLQRLTGPLRQRLPLVTAAALMVIGLLTIAGKLGTSPASALQHPGIHDHR